MLFSNTNPNTVLRTFAMAMTIGVATSAIAPQTVVAQRSTAAALTGRVHAGGHFLVSAPRGDFGENTGNGYGIGASLLWRLDDNGIANARADLSVLTYGRSTRRIALANTGGLVKLDLTTSSNIASFVVGPQLFGTVGAVSPYVSALGGFSVFWTESSVEGSSNDNSPFASTTNSSDAALAYGGALGAVIRVANGDRPIRLDGGVRYLRHDDAKYLTKERVKEAFENDRDPIPVRGRADFFAYYLGATVVVF